MSRRSITHSLLSALLLSVLAACGAPNGPADSDPAQQADAPAEKDEPESASPPDGPDMPPPEVPKVALDTPTGRVGDVIAGRVTGLSVPMDQVRVECVDHQQRVWARTWPQASGAFEFVLRRVPSRRLTVRCRAGANTIAEADLTGLQDGPFPHRPYTRVAWLPAHRLSAQEWQDLLAAGFDAAVATHENHLGDAASLPVLPLGPMKGSPLRWTQRQWNELQKRISPGDPHAQIASRASPAWFAAADGSRPMDAVSKRLKQLQSSHPTGYVLSPELGTTWAGRPLDNGWRSAEMGAFEALSTVTPRDLAGLIATRPKPAGDEPSLRGWLPHRRFLQQRYIDALIGQMELLREAASSDGTAPPAIVGGGALLPDVFGIGAPTELLPALDGWIGMGGEVSRALAWSFSRGRDAWVGVAGTEDWRIGVLEGNSGDVVQPRLSRNSTASSSDAPSLPGIRDLQAPEPHGPTAADIATAVQRRTDDPWWPAVALLLAQVPRDTGEVAVLYSADSLRAAWARDAMRRGADWQAQPPHKNTGLAVLQAWIALLQDLSIPFRLIDADQLGSPQSPRLDPHRLKVLVLPFALVLSPDLKKRLADYQRRGGMLLADGGAGLYTPGGALSDADSVREIFGVTRRTNLPLKVEGRRLTEIDGRALAVMRGAIRLRTADKPTASFALPALPQVSLAGLTVAEVGLQCRDAANLAAMGREPALIFHQQGAGRGILLNLTMSSYADLREQPTARTVSVATASSLKHRPAEDRGHELRLLIQKLLASRGVEPIARMRRDRTPTGTLRAVRYALGDLELFGFYDAVPRKGLRGIEDVSMELPARPGQRQFVMDGKAGRMVGMDRRAALPLENDGLLPPTLVARLPYRLAGIHLQARGDGRAGVFDVELLPQPEPASWPPHVLAVEIRDPAGRCDRLYRTQVLVKDGRATFAVPLPLDAPAGLWSCRVQDVATGTRAVCQFLVRLTDPGARVGRAPGRPATTAAAYWPSERATKPWVLRPVAEGVPAFRAR